MTLRSGDKEFVIESGEVYISRIYDRHEPTYEGPGFRVTSFCSRTVNVMMSSNFNNVANSTKINYMLFCGLKDTVHAIRITFRTYIYKYFKIKIANTDI